MLLSPFTGADGVPGRHGKDGIPGTDGRNGDHGKDGRYLHDALVK